MKISKTVIGQMIPAPKGLRARCQCGARLTTEGGEQVKIVENEHFNGKFYQKTGYAALLARCPQCRHYVKFRTLIRLSRATLDSFKGTGRQ